MRKVVLVLGLVFLGTLTKAQNGLEKVIVERYYVTNSADAAASVGTLPVGSVAYRVYVDMLPGYKFQMAYGNSLHPLTLATTTTFFNNEDRGNTVPNGITVVNTAKNTVLLDSWFSVGATASGKMGLLKKDDTDGSIVSASTIYNNNAAAADMGIQIKTQDGMVVGSPQAVTFVGFDPTGDVFDAASQFGNSFTTNNGAWASLNGSVGANTDTNRVLIGQFTTDGVFTFELNIQIGTPSLGTEQYVAKSPTGNEIQMASLIYASDSPTEIAEVNNSNASNSFQLYPNPATDELTIELINAKDAVDSYTIYSIEGKMVFHKALNGSVEKYKEKIDISSLENGLYIFQLSSGGITTSSTKIIKHQ